MRKILTTFGVGPAREALEISLPLMAEYAARHDYLLVVPSDEEVDNCRHGRPPSWAKISWLRRLCGDYVDSMVLWLDADVVIVRHDKDIVESPVLQADRPFLSMVVQNTPDGSVPSCGVLIANNMANNSKIRYDRIFCSAGFGGMNLVRSAGWWEQAAVIKWLGGDPDKTPIITPPPSTKWGELDYEWNPHPCDPRGIPDDLRFFHATATNDRIGDMRKWAARVQR